MKTFICCQCTLNINIFFNLIRTMCHAIAYFLCRHFYTFEVHFLMTWLFTVSDVICWMNDWNVSNFLHIQKSRVNRFFQSLLTTCALFQNVFNAHSSFSLIQLKLLHWRLFMLHIGLHVITASNFLILACKLLKFHSMRCSWVHSTILIEASIICNFTFDIELKSTWMICMPFLAGLKHILYRNVSIHELNLIIDEMTFFVWFDWTSHGPLIRALFEFVKNKAILCVPFTL